MNRVLAEMTESLYERFFNEKDHAAKVQKYMIGFAKNKGVVDERIKGIASLAALHDIGKIGVDHRIFNKNGELDSEEIEIVRKHAEIGYRIFAVVPELSKYANIILAHHERYDGKGYPKGISGKNIPLYARMLSIADAYAAMTSDRMYRKAYSHEEAVEELRKESNQQFDPELVEIFIHNVLKDESVN